MKTWKCRVLAINSLPPSNTREPPSLHADTRARYIHDTAVTPRKSQRNGSPYSGAHYAHTRTQTNKKRMTRR